MTSVIRRLFQFEDELAALKKEVIDLQAKVTSKEEEITRLNAELDWHKETF